jgi:hypothetical protein
MADWDIEVTEAIGKALPNTFAKLGGYLRYIPYIGQALQVIGALDAGAQSYADTAERLDEETEMPWAQTRQRAASNAARSVMEALGGYNNPGKYGSKGKPDYQWDDYAGMASTLWSGYKGGGGGWGGLANMRGPGMNIYSNLTAPKDIDYVMETPGYFDAFWNQPQQTQTQPQSQGGPYVSPSNYIRRDTITYG